MGFVDVLTKQALRECEPGMVGIARLGFGLPLLFVPWCLVPWPSLTPAFWWTLAAMIPFEILAFFLLLRALRSAPLAETVPFLALSPLLTIIASWAILGERVTPTGFVGLCCIGAGGYLLYWQELRHGYWGPVRAMVRSHGTRLMVLVAAIYSVTSALGKQATVLSSSWVFPGIFFLTLWTAFAAIHLARGLRPAQVWQAVRRRPGVLIPLGALDALGFLVHSLGVVQAPVAYFVGIKRLSAVLSVLIGGLMFREDHLRSRVAGALCMVAGVALLTLRS